MSDETHLFSTHRGVLRFFPFEELASAKLLPGSCRVMNLRNGMGYDFATEAGALAWTKDEPGAPEPLPMAEPTAEEQAEWEALDRELDAESGPDGIPLEDL